MTWEEAKDQIAKEFGCSDVRNFIETEFTYNEQEEFMDRAAKLYARSKWDEACEAQILSCMHQVISRKTIHKVNNARKPEFKP